MKKTSTKKLMYFVAVYSAAEGGYTTVIADFPAYDQGETIEDAIAQATDFVQGIVDEYTAATGKELPPASDIETFKKKLDPEYGEPVCISPVFALPPSPTVRIQLTAKENRIAEIDRYARQSGRTRSDVMIAATIDYIRANT